MATIVSEQTKSKWRHLLFFNRCRIGRLSPRTVEAKLVLAVLSEEDFFLLTVKLGHAYV